MPANKLEMVTTSKMMTLDSDGRLQSRLPDKVLFVDFTYKDVVELENECARIRALHAAALSELSDLYVSSQQKTAATLVKGEETVVKELCLPSSPQTHTMRLAVPSQNAQKRLEGITAQYLEATRAADQAAQEEILGIAERQYKK